MQDLQSLSEVDRKEINRHIASLVEKDRLKKETQRSRSSLRTCYRAPALFHTIRVASSREPPRRRR